MGGLFGLHFLQRQVQIYVLIYIMYQTFDMENAYLSLK